MNVNLSIENNILNPTYLGVSVCAASCVGYLYGVISKTDEKIATLAITISYLSLIAFQLTRRLALGKREENQKAYLMTDLTYNTIGGIIQIVAFRRLNLIATMGTLTLGLAILHREVLIIKDIIDYVITEQIQRRRQRVVS